MRRSIALSVLVIFFSTLSFAQTQSAKRRNSVDSEKAMTQALVPTAGSNPVVGSGTTGQIPKWLGPDSSNSFTIGNSNIFEDKFGKVGIGTQTPTSLLTVQGMIETTLGGYKFPDGTIQTTAGISFVTHDASLAGLGTAASPLGIASGGVQTIHLANNAVTAPKIANGTVVRSFNGLFDNVLLVAGNNITLTPSGNTIVIASPDSLTTVAHNSTLSGNGTTASPLGVANGGIGTTQLADGAVTLDKIAVNQVVTKLNNLTENVTLAAGANISITPSGNTLTIAAAPATGLPKAMIRVDSFGAILSCYNGMTNSSSGNCGFIVTRPQGGIFRINYGFSVSNRFVSVTCEYDANGSFDPHFTTAGANYRYFDSTSVEVFTFNADEADELRSAGFTIILY